MCKLQKSLYDLKQAPNQQALVPMRLIDVCTTTMVGSESYIVLICR
jgi:hypothetical protein